MANILRFDPFFSAFEPLFSQLEGPRRQAAPAFSPRFEVLEREGAFVLVADLPGVTDEALEISVDGRELQISGTRGQTELAEGDKVHLRERGFGRFVRKFTLPEDVVADTIDASLSAGVLTLTLPKQPQEQPRKIPIRVASKLDPTG